MLIAVFYKNKCVSVAGLAILFFIFGAYIASVRLDKLSKSDLDQKNISGNFMVATEPQASGRMQKLILRDESGHKFILNTDAYNAYKYGDDLKINCALSVPSNTGLDFDYRTYLAKDGIYYECKKAKIERAETNSGNKIYAILLKIKNKFDDNISKFIPYPEAGLLSGLILGGDNKLSKEIRDDFSTTGMTHIVAVSGYNVTIIAEYLMIIGIFIGLWRPQAFWFSAVGIILFVIMCGLPSSAVRAGVMGILLIWAMKNGRLANSQNAVLFSAAVMLLFNPLLLRWDIGFQLYFLATLGIIYFYPVLSNYLVKKNKTFGLSEILFLTLSAQIFVLPVILYNFHKLSLISPLANLLVLPIIPFTMLLGFLTVLIGFIFNPLAIIFSWLAYLPLKYETFVINYLANLKYASVEIKLSWRGVIAWYALLLVGIYFAKIKKNKNSLTSKCPSEK
jgi:competence protein ComEC